MRPLFALSILLAATTSPGLASFELSTERAAARAAGLPLTPAELHRVRAPASQNAAPLYANLNALLKRKPLQTAGVDAIPSATWKSGAFTPSQLTAITRLVGSRTDISALIHQIAARPTAYFPHTWSAEELFWYNSLILFSAKWLRWEAISLASRGRMLDAVRTQSLAFRIATHAANDPVMTTYLVSQACERLALAGLEYVAYNPHCNQAVRKAISTELGRYKPSRDLEFVYRGETLRGVTGLHNLNNADDWRVLASDDTDGKSSRRYSKQPPTPKYLLAIRDPNEATYLHWMTRYARAAAESGTARAESLAKVGRDFWAVGRASKTPDHLWSAIAVPVFDDVASRDNDLAARREALIKATGK